MKDKGTAAPRLCMGCKDVVRPRSHVGSVSHPRLWDVRRAQPELAVNCSETLNFRSLSSSALPQFYFFYALRCPAVHPVLQVRLQYCRAERDNPFPYPAGNVNLNAPHGTVVLPGCLGTLLTHVQFAVEQDPQPLSVGLLSSVPSPRLCTCMVAPSQVQNQALVLIVLLVVGACPVL